MDNLLYAFVLIRNTNHEEIKELLSNIPNIESSELQIIEYLNIGVVFSPVSGINPINNQNAALQYAHVIEKIFENFTLLPIRFGSLKPSLESILSLITDNYEGLKTNLIKVEGKNEFGLRVFCDPEKIRPEIETRVNIKLNNNQGLYHANKKSEILDYMERKLIEHRYEETMVEYVNDILLQINQGLDRLKTISKIKKMVSRTQILDAVFLVDKNKKADLTFEVKTLQDQNLGLRFLLTGPWPPYSFVDINLK